MIGRKATVVVLTLAVCPWLADAAWAQRRDPNVRAVQPRATSITAAQIPKGAYAVMPDLTCSVVAWEDKGDGIAVPIPNGAHLVHPAAVHAGDAHPSLLQIFVDNPSALATVGFTVSVSVKRNGLALSSPFTNQVPAMPGGFGRLGLGELILNFPARSNHFVVQVGVDTGADVAEGSESNNACGLSFTVAIQG